MDQLEINEINENSRYWFLENGHKNIFGSKFNDICWVTNMMHCTGFEENPSNPAYAKKLSIQVPFNDPGEKQTKKEAQRVPNRESYAVRAQCTRKTARRGQRGLAQGDCHHSILSTKTVSWFRVIAMALHLEFLKYPSPDWTAYATKLNFSSMLSVFGLFLLRSYIQIWNKSCRCSTPSSVKIK